MHVCMPKTCVTFVLLNTCASLDACVLEDKVCFILCKPKPLCTHKHQILTLNPKS